MFEQVLRLQAQGLETLMRNQSTANQSLIKEAIDDLESAVVKAIQAAKEVNNEAN